MLNIPENQNQKKNNKSAGFDEELSYKDIADTVNQANLPKYQSDDNILDELEQFSSQDNVQKQKPQTIKPKAKIYSIFNPKNILLLFILFI